MAAIPESARLFMAGTVERARKLPANGRSPGCTAEDIFNVAVATVLQPETA